MNIENRVSLASKPSTIREATELTTPKELVSDGFGSSGKPTYGSIDMEFANNHDR